MKSHIQELKRLGACQEAVTWADNYPDMAAIWANCERGDWLLWLLGRLGGEPESAPRKKLVFVCAQVAREVLPIYEKIYPDDKRVRECIEACEAYSRGEITMTELRKRRSAAAADDADARIAMRKRSAEIVRKHYPEFPGFANATLSHGPSGPLAGNTWGGDEEGFGV